MATFQPTDRDCPLCLESLDLQRVGRQRLSCNHWFHERCLLDFRRLSPWGKCPQCRTEQPELKTVTEYLQEASQQSEQGSYDTSFRLASAAYDLDPENAKVCELLANMYQEGRGVATDLARARELCEVTGRMGKDSSASSHLINSLGLWYKEDDQIDKACELLQIAHTRGNNFATFNLGALYYEEGKKDMALTLWQRAHRVGHEVAAFRLAKHYFETENMKRARKYSKAAHEQGNSDGTFLLGQICQSEGNTKRALELWEFAIARAYAEEKNITKAAEWYRVAYQTGGKDENTSEVFEWLSSCLSEGMDVQPDIKKALQFYRLAKEAGASDEDLDDAKEELEKALRGHKKMCTVKAGDHVGIWRSRDMQLRNGQWCALFDSDPISMKFECKHSKPIKQPHWTCCGSTSYHVLCPRTLDTQTPTVPGMALTTVVFRECYPGGFCSRGDKITKVAPGGQADIAGVEAGWHVAQIDGKDYSATSLGDVVSGSRDYAITFQHAVFSVSTPRVQDSLDSEEVDADIQVAVEASLQDDVKSQPSEAAQIAAAILANGPKKASEVTVLELNNSSNALYEALRGPRDHPQLMACIKSMVQCGCMPADSAPALPTQSAAKVFVQVEGPHDFYCVLKSIERAGLTLRNWHVVVSPEFEQPVLSIIQGLPRSAWGGHGGKRVKRRIRIPIESVVKEKHTFIDIRDKPSLHSGPSGGPRVASDSGVPNPRAVVSSSALRLQSI